MGGPFWARKDEHAWSIPKGELLSASAGDGNGNGNESAMDAALREFEEETGIPAPSLQYVELGQYRYTSGKLLTVFAAEAADFDPPALSPGTFDLEWPPRSGRVQQFPEIDRAAWVALDEARRLLVKAQGAMLDDLPS